MPSGVDDLGEVGAGEVHGPGDLGREDGADVAVVELVAHDRRRRDVLRDRDHPLPAQVAELVGRRPHRHRADRTQHRRKDDEIQQQELPRDAASAMRDP